MDVLARITKLRLDRGWTEYELAKRSGLPQSTISTWYARGITATIPSLENICAGFGISLSQFFLEENSGDPIILSRQQLSLITYAARLDPAQYESLLHFLESLHPSTETDPNS